MVTSSSHHNALLHKCSYTALQQGALTKQTRREREKEAQNTLKQQEETLRAIGQNKKLK